MLLTADLSNTYITVGVAEEGKILTSCRMASDKTRTSDEYAALMRFMLSGRGVDCAALEGCILSSVVPELTISLQEALREVTGRRVTLVGPGVKTGLNIRLDDPSELGSDFVAAAVAAQAYYAVPAALVTMDTAMGIGVIDDSGAYIGGVIAPGVMVSSAALTRQASLLPNVIPRAPGHIIGRKTDDCLRSGMIYGQAAMLDGLLEGIERELRQPVSVVATGIWAPAIIPHCRRTGIRVDPDLIHKGLWLIWKKNQKG